VAGALFRIRFVSKEGFHVCAIRITREQVEAAAEARKRGPVDAEDRQTKPKASATAKPARAAGSVRAKNPASKQAKKAPKARQKKRAKKRGGR